MKIFDILSVGLIGLGISGPVFAQDPTMETPTTRSAVMGILATLPQENHSAVTDALEEQIRLSNLARSDLQRSRGTRSFGSLATAAPTQIGLPQTLKAATADIRDAQTALSIIKAPQALPSLSATRTSRSEEAILHLLRPIWLLCDSRTWPLPKDVMGWTSRLTEFTQAFQKTVRSVGRLELFEQTADGWHFRDFVGTAFIVDTRLVVTNRHVIEKIVELPAAGGAFRIPEGFLLRLNMGGEYERCASYVGDHYVNVTGVAYVQKSSDQADDIAVLALENPVAVTLPVLATRRAPTGTVVAVVGFPGEPETGLFTAEQLRPLFMAPAPAPPPAPPTPYFVRRISPGTIGPIRVNENILYYDANSTGGSSGSPVFDIATGEVVALHFGTPTPGWNAGISSTRISSVLQYLEPNKESILLSLMP